MSRDQNFIWGSAIELILIYSVHDLHACNEWYNYSCWSNGLPFYNLLCVLIDRLIWYSFGWAHDNPTTQGHRILHSSCFWFHRRRFVTTLLSGRVSQCCCWWKRRRAPEGEEGAAWRCSTLTLWNLGGPCHEQVPLTAGATCHNQR